jgi:hypothetical protein
MEAYLQAKNVIDSAGLGTLRFVVDNSGSAFVIDPQRFPLREQSFQKKWTFAVFCVAALQRQESTAGLCEFALSREHGDMITQKPLNAFLSSGASIALVDNQYELLRLIFECSFNGEWHNGNPSIETRNVPVSGKLFQEFSTCVRYINHLGDTFRLVW